MKICIFGITGYTGGTIADEALARGHDVVGVSRSVAPGQQERVDLRPGSLFDPELVTGLAREVDVVVVAVPAVSDAGTLLEVLPALLTACAEHDARLGVVGGAGSLQTVPGGPALYDTPEFPEAFRADSKAQGAVLRALQTTGSPADWFYLSPPGLYGKRNPGTRRGTYRLGDDVLLTDDDGRSYVSGADYAIAFLDEIELPKHTRARFTVAY